MKRIYLDYAATTPVAPEVIKAMQPSTELISSDNTLVLDDEQIYLDQMINQKAFIQDKSCKSCEKHERNYRTRHNQLEGADCSAGEHAKRAGTGRRAEGSLSDGRGYNSNEESDTANVFQSNKAAAHSEEEDKGRRSNDIDPQDARKQTIRVTLDTNVLISGTFWTGDSFQIMKLIDEGRIKSILSEEILLEYYKVASSNKIIDFVEKKNLVIIKVIEKVFRNSIMVAPARKLSVVKDDPEDNEILECAVEGDANFIISQDLHLLKLKEYAGIEILTPRDFLMLIRNDEEVKK